jgi:hypothetical protein
MLTLEQFLIACPEFGDTDLQLVLTTLNEAANEIDPCIAGPMVNSLHKYLTAHKLALSPMGQNARMLPGDGMTTYLKHFNDIVRKLPLGINVA